MKVVIQRVKEASVKIKNSIEESQNLERKIQQGLVILLGIEDADSEKDIEWLIHKILQLRIFNDNTGIMNLSLENIQGEILLISQFTLFASTKKGNRPSYIRAAKPEIAIPLYESFIDQLNNGIKWNKKITTGVFGADMEISLVNDGPVTIIIDSKNKE